MSNKIIIQNNRAVVRGFVVNILLILLTAPVIYFFYWLFTTSIVNSMTGNISFKNWGFLFKEMNLDSIIIPIIWPTLWFTIKFAVLVTLLDTMIAVPAAYAFSRLNFKGKTVLMKGLFFFNAFPSATIMIAIFFLLVNLNLVNTLVGVVLVAVATMLPNHVYILKGFFDDIPWDYEWAALVDGCTRFGTFKQVVLPSATSGIGVIMIFAFLRAYSEWFLFKILIFSTKYTTLAKMMQMMLMDDGDILDYGAMTALAIFFAVPVAVFYMLSQRQLMKISNLGGKKLA